MRGGIGWDGLPYSDCWCILGSPGLMRSGGWGARLATTVARHMAAERVGTTPRPSPGAAPHRRSWRSFVHLTFPPYLRRRPDYMQIPRIRSPPWLRSTADRRTDRDDDSRATHIPGSGANRVPSLRLSLFPTEAFCVLRCAKAWCHMPSA